MADLDAAIRQAEEALERWDQFVSGIRNLAPCEPDTVSALRALLDAAKGSAPEPCCNCHGNTGPAPCPCDCHIPGGSTPLSSAGARTEFPGFTFPAHAPLPPHPLEVPLARVWDNAEDAAAYDAPAPLPSAVAEAKERADKAMRDVFGGVDQFGDYCGHPIMPSKLAYAVQELLAALDAQPSHDPLPAASHYVEHGPRLVAALRAAVEMRTALAGCFIEGLHATDSARFAAARDAFDALASGGEEGKSNE